MWAPSLTLITLPRGCKWGWIWCVRRATRARGKSDVGGHLQGGVDLDSKSCTRGVDSVLTEGQREKVLLTTILQNARKFRVTWGEQEWNTMLARSVQWGIVWKIAKGELPTDFKLVLPKGHFHLPKVSEEEVLKWRRREKEAGLPPMVRLGEVTEDLVMPACEGEGWEVLRYASGIEILRL